MIVPTLDDIIKGRMKTVICFIAVLAIVGCEKTKETERVVNFASNTSSKYDLLGGNDVLVQVNDKSLDKKSVQHLIDLRREVVKFSAPAGVRLLDDQLKSVEYQILASVTNMFPHEVALLEFAEKNAIKATKEDITACRNGFSASINMSNVKWEKVLAKFSEANIETINDRVDKESIKRAVKRNFMSKTDICATQKEIDTFYDRYMAYNAECAKTNAMVWGLASNVWSKLVKGADFIELAKKYDESEDRTNDAFEWGNFKILDLKDEPKIWKLQREFKKGWVSPPIESDNGLVILKIDSIYEDDVEILEEDYFPTANTEYKFLRIFMHLPLFIEEISKEQFAAQATQTKRLKAFSDLVNNLVRKLKVSYPSGTDVFEVPSSQNSF